MVTPEKKMSRFICSCIMDKLEFRGEGRGRFEVAIMDAQILYAKGDLCKGQDGSF